MDKVHADLASVLKQFSIEFDSFEVEVYKSGNINSTYRVDVNKNEKTESFVVQKINTFVFSNPVGIMRNIDLVTNHIKQKLISKGIDPSGRVLEFIKRNDGKNYLFENSQSFWRIYRFVPDTVTYNTAENLGILKNAGYSFGEFQNQLSDFPMEKLIDTMPNFHNTPIRMHNFFKALEKDKCGRAKEILREVEIIRENESNWRYLQNEFEKGDIPLRVTHNDTKYNNILINAKTGEAVCVIDLDTVIPGLCAYDFGDAIRFAANVVAEDCPDIEKVSLDLEKYRAFAEGFIPSCSKFCNEKELESLSYGPLTMAFELSARFLEDYLNGDEYFKTTHPGHNLERGKNQLALALDMVKKLGEMQKINRQLYCRETEK